jgi:tight adherence protein B
VSRAVALAFAAGVAGVLAAWDAVGVAGEGTRRVVALLAPLRAGREPSSAERRRLLVVGALAALAAGWLLAGPLAGVALAAAAPAAVGRAVARSRRRARERLAEAAPAVARAIADALGAGASIRAALAGAHDAAPAGAARDELRRLAARLALGERTEAALERLRRRAADPAWDVLVAAVLLQREAGGDLAALLRSLAVALEDGARAFADARALTAQARFTALLVALLPAGGAAIGELAAPGTLRGLLATPLCALLVGLSLALQAAAWAAIRRIARPGP